MLVATHARRHLPEQEERVLKQALAVAPKRPASDRVVVRKVDRNGLGELRGRQLPRRPASSVSCVLSASRSALAL